MKKIALLSSIALLAGCSLIPDYTRPQADVSNSFQRKLNAEVTQPQTIPSDWWKSFNSAELNQWMEKALAQNNDIRAAAARVEQAKANVKIARSALYPQIGASSSAARNYVSGGSSNNLSSFTAGTNVGGAGFGNNRSSYVAGLDVSYELDLFGGNRAAVSAAEANQQASLYEMEALKLVTMAETARAYFTALNFRERIALARNNLKNSEELLRIVNARYEAGAASALEVAQQKSSVATTQASLTALERQGAVAEDALSVLVGQPVQNVQLQQQTLEGINVPMIAPYQPSELLERRPDIRSAEAALIAANANIGVARAQYFPAINLSAGINLATASLSDSARTLTNFGAGLTGPIFSGGAIEGGVELSEARKAELVENYRKAILVSLQEVEDSLAGTRASADRNTSLQESVNQARRAYELSRELYKSGAVDFQKLLDSERILIQTEDNYAQTRLENLSAAIDLYKALGGGWGSAPTAENINAAVPVNNATTPIPSDSSNKNPVVKPNAVTTSQNGGTLIIESANKNDAKAVDTAQIVPPPAAKISR